MKPLSKKIDTRHKNNKFLYYLKVLSRQLVPNAIFRAKLDKKLASIEAFDRDYIRTRVNYYNKLSAAQSLSDKAGRLEVPERQKAYYFDTREYLRYFDPGLKANYLFGDVTKVPAEPAIVKSRPIQHDNQNSVVLNLDKLRHFNFLRDKRSFENKKDMLVGRGVVEREHRIRFYELYFNHPMCNLGQINRGKNEYWIRDFLTIDEHLDYKFILCLEGNDVATNLKWVMSSNSLSVMPRSRFETWYMEGTLLPDYHYVAIQEDYSDLEEKMKYYISHPAEALKIIANAHAYVEQFKNKGREDLISLLVLEKYFYQTGQLQPKDASLFD